MDDYEDTYNPDQKADDNRYDDALYSPEDESLENEDKSDDDDLPFSVEDSDDYFENDNEFDFRLARAELQETDKFFQHSNKPHIIYVLKPEERITDNCLHLLEAGMLIGKRAEQIAKNPIVFVDTKGETDPVVIAQMELENRNFPLNLRRIVAEVMGGLIVEDWVVNEMALPLLPPHGMRL